MSKPTALIVEDNPQLNQVYTRSLVEGFEVRSFQDVPAALAFLEGDVPALVVLDLHLPGGSGRTLLEHIRGDARLAATRVILTTADVQMSRMLEGQVDIVLLKPVSPSQLRELASRLCAGRPGG